jgi:hypothetical protein
MPDSERKVAKTTLLKPIFLYNWLKQTQKPAILQRTSVLIFITKNQKLPIST